MALDGQFAVNLVFLVGFAFHFVCPEVVHLVYVGVESSAEATNCFISEVELLPVEGEGDVVLCGIEYGEGPVAPSEGFEPEL